MNESIQEKFRKFRLHEAEALLPEIIALTSETIARIELERRQIEAETSYLGDDVQKAYSARVDTLLEGWAQKIMELGVLPKGYFTCDFQSLNPETYLCWTYGEEKIRHVHKVTESFKDRRLIEEPFLEGFAVSLN